jgi:hypothetical protein
MARIRWAISSRSQMRGDPPTDYQQRALEVSATQHACHLPESITKLGFILAINIHGKDRKMAERDGKKAVL